MADATPTAIAPAGRASASSNGGRVDEVCERGSPYPVSLGAAELLHREIGWAVRVVQALLAELVLVRDHLVASALGVLRARRRFGLENCVTAMSGIAMR